MRKQLYASEKIVQEISIKIVDELKIVRFNQRMGQETKAIAVSLRPDNLAWLRQEKKKRFEATGQTHSMNRIISEIVYLHIKALGTKNVAPPISDRMTRPE